VEGHDPIDVVWVWAIIPGKREGQSIDLKEFVYAMAAVFGDNW
jgi:hypothetical protein